MTRPLNIIYTYGPSGSGKSTWARAQQAKDPSIVLVSRDELRALLHGGKWSKSNEKQVVALQNQVILQALSDGRSVIVHDTNLHPSNGERYCGLATHVETNITGRKVTVVRKDFLDVDMETCIKRDLERGKAHGVVGAEVIQRQFRDYINGKPAQAPEYDATLPDAVIVDMDGTLALNPEGPTHRSFYDETGLCIHDVPNKPVCDLVRLLQQDTHIIICSGRFDTFLNRNNTAAWLTEEDIRPTAIYMRPAGDQRKDNLIKSEIYEGSIRGRFNIRFVLDDRRSVVEFWRSKGLTCLQVAPGDF